MELVKRHTIDHRQRTIPDHASSMKSDVTAATNHQGNGQVDLTKTSGDGDDDFTSKRNSSKKETASETGDAGLRFNASKRPRNGVASPMTASGCGVSTTAAASAATNNHHHQGALHKGTSVAVIKAKYLRSLQQYRKLASLIDLLTVQRNKLESRRRQLQRTMCALSTMYRINSSPTAARGIAVSSSTSSPPRPGSYRPTQPNAVVVDPMLLSGGDDTHDEVIYIDYSASESAEDLDVASAQTSPLHDAHNESWLAIDSDNEEPAFYLDGMFVEEERLTRARGQPVMSARGLPHDAYREHRGSDRLNMISIPITVAHCKSNSIAIDVREHELPVAAHTCKADLSSYSYMQFSRPQNFSASS